MKNHPSELLPTGFATPNSLQVSPHIAERQLADRARREGEERFRLAANAAPVLIWMSGPDKL
ncbi:MAG TPA: hypothetical protein VED66_11195, partial [Candidatus Sulfotelmatobacter sp.]|nr:hypothetical protein [Candidatus Sulfotelmatobacter sp.]